MLLPLENENIFLPISTLDKSGFFSIIIYEVLLEMISLCRVEFIKEINNVCTTRSKGYYLKVMTLTSCTRCIVIRYTTNPFTKGIYMRIFCIH